MTRRTTAVLLSAAVLAGVSSTSLARAEERQVPAGSVQTERRPDVIFVPTRELVIEAMLKAANVTPNDVVYDLGCGDGRIVVAAAKLGARAVGIDIDPQRIKEANENAAKNGVTGKAQFRQEDLFEADIREATVVTLYLLPSLNVKLRPRLMEQLRPGTRIVSHDFDMGDWAPEQTISVDGKTVYLWTIPKK
jgi:SAM-dependent methyltransferase